MIRENGGWTEFEMKPYKEFPCENEIQLCIEEENCRKLINANLNSQRCYTTEAEAKERDKATNAIYREANKEEINEYKKNYYEANKEEIKEKDAIYYEANKESIKEKVNIYREANRESIREKQKEKITCECGCIVNKNHLARHKKSNKHINFIEK